MNRNRIREVLDAGDVPLGFGVQTFNPALVEIAGRAGVDFVWLDLEHGGFSPFDTQAMEGLVRAADATSISTLVRVPGFDDKIIAKVLDSGVHAILVTDVGSKADVAKAVAATKFLPPTGDTLRGAGIMRSFGWSSPSLELAQKSDQQTMVGAMVESKNLIDNLQDILSVKGLDFLFIGPADLSISLGVHFQTAHPLVKEYAKKTLDAAKSMSIPVGYPAGDAERAKEAIKEGYRILRIGVDTAMVSKDLGNLLKAIRS
jgi:2-keto-3-deoxy-L-rhamnonate aldolase RhmA